jgi:type IV pilus assembly protein PilM
MVRWFTRGRMSPIGIDLGSRSVKLVQFSSDRSRLLEAVRWDLPTDEPPDAQERSRRLVEALRQAREGRHFRGKDAVLCLGNRELFVQNLRVAKVTGGDLDQAVRQEVEGRLPFPVAETELRYLEAAEVRQGDTTRREIIVLACHRPVLEQSLKVIEDAGLHPVAVDVEPLALLRSYANQFRRDIDKDQRSLFVHIGASNTVVVIAQGSNVLFLKYVDLGGKHFDEAVARHLKMDLAEAWALRRHNGDRRVDQQDPEISRSVAESIRPVIDRLANELSMCIRYHSVTFRGQPLVRLVLGGGEAAQSLVDTLATRIDVKCELGDPLRSYEAPPMAGRKSQWDVAAGLALRQIQ